MKFVCREIFWLVFLPGSNSFIYDRSIDSPCPCPLHRVIAQLYRLHRGLHPTASQANRSLARSLDAPIRLHLHAPLGVRAGLGHRPRSPGMPASLVLDLFVLDLDFGWRIGLEREILPFR